MKAVTYIVIDGKEIELDQVSNDQLKELGLEYLIEQKTDSSGNLRVAPTSKGRR